MPHILTKDDIEMMTARTLSTMTGYRAYVDNQLVYVKSSCNDREGRNNDIGVAAEVIANRMIEFWGLGECVPRVQCAKLEQGPAAISYIIDGYEDINSKANEYGISMDHASVENLVECALAKYLTMDFDSNLQNNLGTTHIDCSNERLKLAAIDFNLAWQDNKLVRSLDLPHGVINHLQSIYLLLKKYLHVEPVIDNFHTQEVLVNLLVKHTNAERDGYEKLLQSIEQELLAMTIKEDVIEQHLSVVRERLKELGPALSQSLVIVMYAYMNKKNAYVLLQGDKLLRDFFQNKSDDEVSNILEQCINGVELKLCGITLRDYIIYKASLLTDPNAKPIGSGIFFENWSEGCSKENVQLLRKIACSAGDDTAAQAIERLLAGAKKNAEDLYMHLKSLDNKDKILEYVAEYAKQPPLTTFCNTSAQCSSEVMQSV